MRPEHVNPPEIFYSREEARKYATSNRMLEIQTKMSERAIELMNFPTNSSKFILDIGCGTGLSGKVLEKHGHFWIGTDISRSMLEVGRTARESESLGDTIESDMGTGISFRSGTFDGCISISALQWLCQANSSDEVPIRRINRFFNSLYSCMVRGARCVFQFYPENTQQVEMLTTSALKSGFTGGMLVDYPNSAKAKKYFLVLFAGILPGQKQSMPEPKGMDETTGTIRYESDRKRKKNMREKKKNDGTQVKSKEWILDKKERRAMQGKKTAKASSYTGRNRGPRF